QVLDPVRVHRVRAGRRSARGPAGAGGPLPRIRGESRRHLLVLHPALDGAGLRRAGARAARLGTLAAEHPPRLDRHRAVPTGGTRSAAHSEPAARPRGRRSAGLDAHGPRAPRSRDVTKRRLLLPTIARHLIVEFLRTFALTLAAFVAIYVIAD